MTFDLQHHHHHHHRERKMLLSFFIRLHDTICRKRWKGNCSAQKYDGLWIVPERP